MRRLMLGLLAILGGLSSLTLAAQVSLPLHGISLPTKPQTAEGVLTVLRSDPFGLLLEYSPGELSRSRLGAGSMEVLRITDCATSAELGKPEVPLRSVLFGVPFGAGVRVQILEADLQDLGEIDLAPVPQGDGSGEMAWAKDPAIYSSNALYPPGVAQLDGPFQVRSQRVGFLRLSPIQYNPALKRAYLCRKMRVQVSFTPGKGVPQGAYSDGFEDVFKSALVNFEQAKLWREPPSPPRVQSFIFDTGPWYKVKVVENGLYKVTGSDLQKAGIDISQVDPRTIKFYNGGGKLLLRNRNAPLPDTMPQLAIWVVGEEDGRFDPTDYIVFWGKGPFGPHYDDSLDSFQYFNPYTDTNVYWLTWGGSQGRRMGVPKDGSLSSPNPIRPPSFMSRVHVEQDNLSIYNSGIRWYWEELNNNDPTQSAYYKASLASVETQESCSLWVSIAGTGKCKNLPDCNIPWDRDVNIWFNGNLVWNNPITGRDPQSSRRLASGYGSWAREGENTLQVERRGDWLSFDWYEIVYRRRYEAQSGRLDFSVAGNTARGRYEFGVSNFPEATIEVFDITDPFAPSRIAHPPAVPSGGAFILRFQDDVDTLRSYTASTVANYKSPAGITPKPYSNLHDPNNTADYILITNDLFYDQMQAIRNLRSRNHTVLLVRLSNVYDEFSWGLPDPTAVRNFLRYAYDYWGQGQRIASYAMLVGDGSSDFKNLRHLSHPKSLFPIYTSGDYYDLGALGIEDTMTDDWFAYFHNDSLGQPLPYPEMKLGRLPVQTLEDASIVIDKILRYDSPETFGAWRNRAVFVADDEYLGCQGRPDTYGLEHVRQTEDIATQHFTRQFDFTKIYLTEYTLDTNCKKPGAEADVIKAISDGAVFVSFVGHGGWWIWAHEQAFLAPADVTLLSNGKKLPIISSASCSVGKFHMVNDECMAELEVRARDKGAIATVAAVGGTYGGGPNETIVKLFLDKAFHDSTDIGTGLLYAKMTYPNTTNNESILILGDPGLSPAQPRLPLSLNVTDTIGFQGKRLVTVTGTVIGGFTGTALVTAFDSDTLKLYRSLGDSVFYRLPGKPIFRGPAPVSNGQFSASFIVPTGLRAGKSGRVSVYVWNDQVDAHGAIDSIPVRGTDDTTARDDGRGPSIALYANGKRLMNGDRVASSFTLVGVLEDDRGINLSSQQPERYRLRMVVNQDRLNAKYLSDYFTYDLGSYTKGSFSTPILLYSPSEGDSTYTLAIEAADNFLNRSTDSVKVVVGSDLTLRVQNLVNYPNPFKDDTQFTFELTQSAEAEIKIYTVAGRLIRSLRPGILPAGYNQMYWNGKDADGDGLANGVYLYKITAKAAKPGSSGTASEITAKEFGRLVVMR